MNKIIVNENIKLVPYFENYETTLKWYEDKDVCKQVDNIDFLYDKERLKKCTIIWILMGHYTTLNIKMN